MISVKEDLRSALQQYFGFDEFKPFQEEIVQSVLDGKDTFVIMPTGGGKSLCYQLPALIMPGTAIIISPLIALMKNQVDSIRGHSQKDNIAHFLNSSLNKGQMKEVKDDIMMGKTKMLFIAPETLTKEENIDFFKRVNLSFVAVDEAHCISEWGHDFRPEYRKIRSMIDGINKEIPIIALTATATTKVRSDIVKNLHMNEVNSFITSFNRDNLFYEVRPKVNKEQAVRSIVQIIKGMAGKSGIIYFQSRKATEELAKVLVVNGIKASAYHAGLDAKTRSKVQDDFLMEEIDVICATIAFGMGIDKPDVRFVIHYDIPKSIENYYQETGRGGRDGLEGRCIAFYSLKDILRLEKFLRDKPVAERELGAQLLEEMIAYSETGSCRRKFLLHYFGEEFEQKKCEEKCDNCKNPKEEVEAGPEILIALKTISELNENHSIKLYVEYLTGKNSKEMKDFRYDTRPHFGEGKDKDDFFWHSLYRQALLHDLCYKDVEKYGLLKLTPKGLDFIKNPKPFKIHINHNYVTLEGEEIVIASGSGGAALDDTLLSLLKDLRKSEAKKLNVKPWIIFFDPSLQDMATYYPVNMEDMVQISGVSKGKVERYGKPFIELIEDYIEENNIERPSDFVVRQVADKSKSKVAIIQGVDRKLPLDDIADSVNLNMEQLINEMEAIVTSGTKLDIDYYLDENVDEYASEDIYDYFSDAESESIEDAFSELKEDDITLEEIQLVRIKFLSDMAN
jgi:ATP-dependent DNA helicase RecQ